MRPVPKDVNGDKVERELKEDFAIDNRQIPNGSFFREIQRILPIFGVTFRQVSKAPRIQFGGENHLRMPEYRDEDVREKEEEKDGVPSGASFE